MGKRAAGELFLGNMGSLQTSIQAAAVSFNWLSGIATSYSKVRHRVFMPVNACRSDRYELIAAWYS
jgi:hypothetical protein